MKCTQCNGGYMAKSPWKGVSYIVECTKCGNTQMIQEKPSYYKTV